MNNDELLLPEWWYLEMERLKGDDFIPPKLEPEEG